MLLNGRLFIYRFVFKRYGKDKIKNEITNIYTQTIIIIHKQCSAADYRDKRIKFYWIAHT